MFVWYKILNNWNIIDHSDKSQASVLQTEEPSEGEQTDDELAPGEF